MQVAWNWEAVGGWETTPLGWEHKHRTTHMYVWMDVRMHVSIHPSTHLCIDVSMYLSYPVRPYHILSIYIDPYKCRYTYVCRWMSMYWSVPAYTVYIYRTSICLFIYSTYIDLDTTPKTLRRYQSTEDRARYSGFIARSQHLGPRGNGGGCRWM